MRGLQDLYIAVLTPVYKHIKHIPGKIKDMITAICFGIIFGIILLEYTTAKFMTNTEQALVVCVFLFVIIVMSIDKLEHVPNNKLLAYPWFICGAMIMLISFIHEIGSGGRALSMMMLVGFPCVYFVWNNRKDYNKLFQLVSKGVAVSGALFFICNMLLAGLDDGTHFLGGRYIGLTGNPNGIGIITASVFIGALYLIGADIGKKWYCFAVFTGTLSNVFVVLCLSRTAMLCNMAVMVFFIAFYSKTKIRQHPEKRKNFAVLAAALALFLLGAVIAYNLVMEPLYARMPQTEAMSDLKTARLTAQNQQSDGAVQDNPVMDRIDIEGKDLNAISSGRIALWKIYLAELDLLGHGKAPDDAMKMSSHNSVIEVSYRMGIVTGIVYLFIELLTLIWAVRYTFLLRYREPFYLFVAMSVVGLFIYSMLEVTIYPFRVPITFLYYMAMAPMFSMGEKRMPGRKVRKFIVKKLQATRYFGIIKTYMHCADDSIITKEGTYVKTIGTILKEHIEWRSQIMKLAKADIIKTYSGTALGWAWAIVQPAITILVFWFAFSIGLRHGDDIAGYPFILWLIAGIVPWFYMKAMITQGAGAMHKYKHLVTKMKFPISVIPTFVGLSKFTMHLCLMVIVVVIFMLFGYLPDIYFLQLPFYMVCMVAFFIAWALFSSLLSAVSKDFLNLIKSLNTAIFWMSGILWDVNSIDIQWLQTLLKFNPVTYVAMGYRNVFIYKVWFWEDLSALGFFCMILVALSAAAVWAYKRLSKEIADVL